MIVPSLFAAILAWAGVLGDVGALAMQHGVMIPAMLAVMLWRYEDYSQAHSQGVLRKEVRSRGPGGYAKCPARGSPPECC